MDLNHESVCMECYLKFQLGLPKPFGSMIQTGLLASTHADLVTDSAFDYYGLRLATTSLDQRSVQIPQHKSCASLTWTGKTG